MKMLSVVGQVNFTGTCLPPNSDCLAVVVDLPALLTLRPHEVDQGVQKHLDPGHHLKSQLSHFDVKFILC